jgi:hypothetical protein
LSIKAFSLAAIIKNDKSQEIMPMPKNLIQKDDQYYVRKPGPEDGLLERQIFQIARDEFVPIEYPPEYSPEIVPVEPQLLTRFQTMY